MEHGLQSEWASVVAAHRLSSCGSWALEHRLNSCGAEAQSLYGMWDLPGWGTEPVSPALAGNSLPLSHQGSAKMVFFFFSISVAFHCWFLLQADSLHLNHREAHYKARTPQFFKWFYGNRCVTDFLNRVNFLGANFRITAELSTKYRQFSYTSWPPPCSLPHYQHPSPEWHVCCSQWHVMISNNPEFTLGFTLGIVYSVGFDTHIVTCLPL